MVGDNMALARGLSDLPHMDRMNAEAATVCAEFKEKFIAVRTAAAFAQGDYAAVLGFLEITRHIDPAIAHIFPEASRCRNQSHVWEPRGNAPSSLLSFRASAPGTERSRRVLFLCRKFFYGPASRLHDAGPRFKRAFDRAGWPCTLVDPGYEDRSPRGVNARRLLDVTVEATPDVVVFDACGIHVEFPELIEFLIKVRGMCPDVRMVFLHFDPWIKQQWAFMRAIATLFDAVWCPFPAAEVLQTPELRDKVTFIPFPVGVGLDELPVVERQDVAAFQGAVAAPNFSRAFWMVSLQLAQSRVESRVTTHLDDGLDPIDSYRHYLSRFQTVERLVNFSLRSDGSRIVTGRTFEAIYAGTCLLQEHADDLAYYFVPFLHYLPFTTFEDLQKAFTYCEQEPKEALAVRERAQEFYLEKYEDRKLVRYLEHVLYGT